jgi:hypothetical protein
MEGPRIPRLFRVNRTRVAFLRRFHRHWRDDPTLDPALIPADLPPPLATIYRELGALVETEPGLAVDDPDTDLLRRITGHPFAGRPGRRRSTVVPGSACPTWMPGAIVLRHRWTRINTDENR